MPAATRPGEIWMVDLGYTAKVRPCLILSDYPSDTPLSGFSGSSQSLFLELVLPAATREQPGRPA
jgi:hypothetical protein